MQHTDANNEWNVLSTKKWQRVTIDVLKISCNSCNKNTCPLSRIVQQDIIFHSPPPFSFFFFLLDVWKKKKETKLFVISSYIVYTQHLTYMYCHFFVVLYWPLRNVAFSWQPLLTVYPLVPKKRGGGGCVIHIWPSARMLLCNNPARLATGTLFVVE